MAKRVALLLVSHSRALAEATRALARQMVGERVPIECAAGIGEHGEELGTDATAIVSALEALESSVGIVVLMDLGSAILSAETALELVDPAIRAMTRLVSAPFVEGAVAAAVRAGSGATLDDVVKEARRALVAKKEQLAEAESGAESGAESEAAAAAESAAESAAVAAAESAAAVTLDVAIADPHGLHARPAARLARRAADFAASITLQNLTNNKGPAPISSPIALASLGARRDHLVRVIATGKDARPAAAAIATILREEPSPASIDSPSKTNTTSITPTRGIPVAPGVTVGPLLRLSREEAFFSEHAIDDPAAEIARINEAIEHVARDLSASLGRDDMADAHEALLRDAALTGRARELIATEHKNAAAAIAQATAEAADILSRLDDPYMRAREADVRDVGLAVIYSLSGKKRPRALVFPDGPPAVLLVDDLLPSEASRLDPERVLGVLDKRGGPTSHAAILLRAARIPAVFGVGSIIANAPSATLAGLDGSTGEVWLDPADDTLADLQQRRSAHAAARRAPRGSGGLVTLSDGRAVELWANVAGVADARAAKEAGAIGVGLLRTEMLFLDRQDEPSEDEQADLLSAIFSVFPSVPMIVRTLDAGGDKAIPYVRLPREANPYLGVRGIRLSLDRMPLFETQLRAILRAASGRDVRLMIPMVATPAEIGAARAAVVRAHESLVAEGRAHLFPIPLGIMVEVPSAALSAHRLARHVDFFSIGTNDLTQYTLAAERGHAHPAIASLSSAADPAVLSLIQNVRRAGEAASRPVSICGEAAADPALAALFVGLGITRLSMGAAHIDGVRAALSGADRNELERAAQRALEAD